MESKFRKEIKPNLVFIVCPDLFFKVLLFKTSLGIQIPKIFRIKTIFF